MGGCAPIGTRLLPPSDFSANFRLTRRALAAGQSVVTADDLHPPPQRYCGVVYQAAQWHFTGRFIGHLWPAPAPRSAVMGCEHGLSRGGQYAFLWHRTAIRCALGT